MVYGSVNRSDARGGPAAATPRKSLAEQPKTLAEADQLRRSPAEQTVKLEPATTVGVLSGPPFGVLGSAEYEGTLEHYDQHGRQYQRLQPQDLPSADESMQTCGSPALCVDRVGSALMFGR